MFDANRPAGAVVVVNCDHAPFFSIQVSPRKPSPPKPPNNTASARSISAMIAAPLRTDGASVRACSVHELPSKLHVWMCVAPSELQHSPTTTAPNDESFV